MASENDLIKQKLGLTDEQITIIKKSGLVFEVHRDNGYAPSKGITGVNTTVEIHKKIFPQPLPKSQIYYSLTQEILSLIKSLEDKKG